MSSRQFIEWLGPLAGVVLVGGWVLAVVAFLVIGTETCSTVEVPLAGQIEACTDTSATAVILLTVIGFGATLGALFLWALRYVLASLEAIAENTRGGRGR